MMIEVVLRVMENDQVDFVHYYGGVHGSNMDVVIKDWLYQKFE